MTAASKLHLFYFFFFVSLCFVSVFGLAFVVLLLLLLLLFVVVSSSSSHYGGTIGFLFSFS